MISKINTKLASPFKRIFRQKKYPIESFLLNDFVFDEMRILIKCLNMLVMVVDDLFN